MAQATSIRSADYSGGKALGYGRLFTPPASISSRLRGAYVLSTKFHEAPLFDWSGRGNDLTNNGAAIGEEFPNLSSTGFFQTPVTGEALYTENGAATLIAVHKTPILNNAPLISNQGAASGQSYGVAVAGQGVPGAGGGIQTISNTPTARTAATGAVGHGGSYAMSAGVLEASFTRVFHRAPYAAGWIYPATNPVAGDTVTINGQAITFVGGTPAGAQVQIQATAVLTGGALATYINANTVALGVTAISANFGYVNLTANASGSAGNSITLAKSSAALTLSGATLTGATSLFVSTANTTMTAPAGGANPLRIGYGYPPNSSTGTTQIAAALLVAGALTQAELDTVYGELKAQLSDYDLVL